MRLVSVDGWAIVQQNNSFLYYEMNYQGDEIGYFKYTFDNIVKIDKDTYSECKYGKGYNIIMIIFYGAIGLVLRLEYLIKETKKEG